MTIEYLEPKEYFELKNKSTYDLNKIPKVVGGEKYLTCKHEKGFALINGYIPVGGTFINHFCKECGALCKSSALRHQRKEVNND